MKNRAVELKRARKKRGWTQSEAAARLGVTQSYVSLLESGRRPAPASLVPKLRKQLGLSVALPPRESNLKPDSLPGALAALGYEPFGYLRGRRPHNPAGVLLAALRQPDLPSRVVEGLPWVALHRPDLDWPWLVERAKVHNVQNRLGFVLALASEMAEGQLAARLCELVQELEPSRLEREGTLCHDSMTEVERSWLREERPPQAKDWHLLTGLSSAQLSYA